MKSGRSEVSSAGIQESSPLSEENEFGFYFALGTEGWSFLIYLMGGRSRGRVRGVSVYEYL